jgi:outer membrane lipopolysaccharide assembly protein LptE/RlpB
MTFMKKMLKAAALVVALSTLTACTGHIENKSKNCSYDYLLHPAISISKIIGGCGPAAEQ